MAPQEAPGEHDLEVVMLPLRVRSLGGQKAQDQPDDQGKADAEGHASASCARRAPARTPVTQALDAVEPTTICAIIGAASGVEKGRQAVQEAEEAPQERVPSSGFDIRSPSRVRAQAAHTPVLSAGWRSFALSLASRGGLARSARHPLQLAHEGAQLDPRIAQAQRDVARELLHHLGSLSMHDRSLVEAAVADEALGLAHPRGAPEPIALAVARRLRELARVQPIQQRLLADAQLVRDFQRGQVFHGVRGTVRRGRARFSRNARHGVNVGRAPRPLAISNEPARLLFRGPPPRPWNKERRPAFPARGTGLDLEVTRDARFEAEALPHLKRLLAAAYRMTGNAADAEDLVQETLLRGYRAFDRYTPGTNCKAWLYTILQRVRTDALRKRGRAPETVELEGDGPAVPGGQAGALQQRDLESVLRTLPEILPDGRDPARRGRAELRGDRGACSRCPSAP